MLALLYTATSRYGRILRFIVSGGAGAVVNLTVLFVLVHYLGMYPVLASGGSFIAAFFVSFTLQKLWTYRNFDRENAGGQMIIYFVIQLINLGINTALMYFFVEFTTLHYLVAQIVTSGVIAVESFFLYKHMVFIKKEAPPL